MVSSLCYCRHSVAHVTNLAPHAACIHATKQVSPPSLQAQQVLERREQEAGSAAQDLSTAEEAVAPLHEKIRKEHTTIDKVGQICCRQSVAISGARMQLQGTYNFI